MMQLVQDFQRLLGELANGENCKSELIALHGEFEKHLDEICKEDEKNQFLQELSAFTSSIEESSNPEYVNYVMEFCTWMFEIKDKYVEKKESHHEHNESSHCHRCAGH